MSFKDIRWQHHFREFKWGFLVGPLATPIYLCLAVLVSTLISAATGLNPLMLAAAAIGITIIISPKRRLLKIKNRRQ